MENSAFLTLVYHGDPLVTAAGTIIETCDQLLVDLTDKPRKGDVFYLCLDTGERMFVQLTGIGHSSLAYQPLQNYCPDSIVSNNQIIISGKVVMKMNGEIIK